MRGFISSACLTANDLSSLTRGGFAYGGVFRAHQESVHAQTVEAAVRVDAPLCARVGSRTLVDVNTSLSIVFQAEARMASTLRGGKARSG